MFKTNNQKLPILLLRITCVFWILVKSLSYKLWHTDRLFPVSPPFSFLENIPDSVHLALFFSAISGMALLLAFPKNNLLLLSVITIEFSACLLDQNRWQPWEYQCMILFCLAFFFRDDPRRFLNFLAFLLVAVYVNSGLHKLSGGFLHNGWDKTILGNFLGLPRDVTANKWLHYSGLLLGVIEAGAGIGILLLKNKRTPALLLIMMHVIILYMLSPAGINHNFIVWPWNAAMIIYLGLLFLNTDTNFVRLDPLIKKWNLIPFTLIGILPLFCYIGWFDDFLSFNVYSGTSADMEICIGDETAFSKYEPYSTDRPRFCQDVGTVNVTAWALEELSVPAYPEKRVYEDIIAKFKQANPGSKATFYIFKYPYIPEDIQQYD